jgi:two-component system, LytTR family, response regulator LytT
VAPLRALVVEDEWPARNYLVELLEMSHAAQVVGAVATVDEAREALQTTSHLSVDVVFVDVQLAEAGDRAGLELVRSLAKTHTGLLFVLATAFEQHALEAFDLGVVDYLLKPFTEERVAQCLERLAQRNRTRPGTVAPLRIVARRKRNLVFLEPSEIWAFEAADRLTFVHTQAGRFDMDLSLSAIEVSFGRALTRVHRNWLVNAAHVKELEREGNETRLFVGTGLGGDATGVRVPVSRDRVQLVRESLLADAAWPRRS